MRETCNIEGMDGPELEGYISRHKGSRESACMFQGQIGKTASETPGRLGNCPVLALLFHLSLPEIWLTRSHKNYIFETIKDRATISQNLATLT